MSTFGRLIRNLRRFLGYDVQYCAAVGHCPWLT
jgi:hypothetical protein